MDQPPSILLIDDDPTSVALLRRPLSEMGQLRFATSGSDGLRLAHARVPDVILLDVEMPGMTGYEVCAALKHDAVLRDVPIIFITSHDGVEQEITGLTLGAADFISKPLRAALVIARVRTQLSMKAMADALRRAATTDGLTGLANRRLLDDTVLREWSRCHRSHSPLSLLMIDADHFKAYNDRYGHQAGDQCLAAIAAVMRQIVRRPADLCARYGGEEFCMLLPDTHNRGALQIAERLRSGLESLQLPHTSSSVADHVTVSIGGVTHHYAAELAADAAPPVPLRQAHDLVAAADAALYAAKRAGRNRVAFAELERAHGATGAPITYHAALTTAEVARG